MNRQELIQSLINNWHGDIVPRTKFYEFSGGAFKPGTMANRDCRKMGPKGRMMLGKSIYYPKAEAAVWVEGGTFSEQIDALHDEQPETI